MEADSVSVGFTARSSSLAIATGRWELTGYSLAERAGTPAIAYVRFRDGTDATGPIRAVAQLVASGTDAGPNLDEGIRCTTGIYMEVVAGTVEGAVFLR